MITSEDELKQLIRPPDRKEALQPKFRRMIDRVLVNNDPSKREIAAERLSEILAKIVVAFAEKNEQAQLVTSVFKRETFMEKLKETMSLLERCNTPAVLAFVDVDYLKRFNDTQGHQAGDVMLKLEGECITKSIRTVDFAGRYGGDEFVVFIPGADLDGGELVAQRLAATSRRRMSEAFPDYSYPQTLSIGIAEFMPDDTVESLMERADQAMYFAKQERNRIVSVSKDPQSRKLNFKVVAPNPTEASS